MHGQNKDAMDIEGSTAHIKQSLFDTYKTSRSTEVPSNNLED